MSDPGLIFPGIWAIYKNNHSVVLINNNENEITKSFLSGSWGSRGTARCGG